MPSLPGAAQECDSETLGSDSTRETYCSSGRLTVPFSVSAAMLQEVEAPGNGPILTETPAATCPGFIEDSGS